MRRGGVYSDANNGYQHFFCRERWSMEDEALFRSGNVVTTEKERHWREYDDDAAFLAYLEESSVKHDSDTTFDTYDHEIGFPWMDECDSCRSYELGDLYMAEKSCPADTEELAYQNALDDGDDEATSRLLAKARDDDEEYEQVWRQHCPPQASYQEAEDYKHLCHLRRMDRKVEADKKERAWINKFLISRDDVRLKRILRVRRLERRHQKAVVKGVVDAVVAAVLEAAAGEEAVAAVVEGAVRNVVHASALRS